MSAQIILGKATFTIRGADHLHVEGDLVEIQRSGPTGYETVAVVGEDLLVTIATAEREPVEIREPGVEVKATARPTPNSLHWHPVGAPLD